jgi:hypothetical protein
MKKTPFSTIIIALFSLLIVTSIQAQLPADRIETLIVDLWPDYDEPSVLVLLTGTLPQDTPLPATVTIPLPDNVQLHAIARITTDNRMIDDLVYTTENDMLTFTTPDPRFRVEYYAPYESTGSNHAYSFDWLADLRVESIIAAVQQPSSALSMNVTPENANIVADNTDGFTYYTFPPQAIPAGEPFTIAFDYTMSNPPVLSVDNLPATGTVSNTDTNPTSPTTSSSSNSFMLGSINWVLVVAVLGVVLTAVLITWQVATRKTQPASKSRKPHPKRDTAAPKSTGKARFCHQCGNALTAQDKFCRKCGTAVKGS